MVWNKLHLTLYGSLSIQYSETSHLCPAGTFCSTDERRLVILPMMKPERGKKKNSEKCNVFDVILTATYFHSAGPSFEIKTFYFLMCF